MKLFYVVQTLNKTEMTFRDLHQIFLPQYEFGNTLVLPENDAPHRETSSSTRCRIVKNGDIQTEEK